MNVERFHRQHRTHETQRVNVAARAPGSRRLSAAGGSRDRRRSLPRPATATPRRARAGWGCFDVDVGGDRVDLLGAEQRRRHASADTAEHRPTRHPPVQHDDPLAAWELESVDAYVIATSWQTGARRTPVTIVSAAQAGQEGPPLVGCHGEHWAGLVLRVPYPADSRASTGLSVSRHASESLTSPAPVNTSSERSTTRSTSSTTDRSVRRKRARR